MSIRIPIVLASTSARRQELLRQIGIEFEVFASGVSENIDEPRSPREIAKILAERKSLAVAHKQPNALVIGADTVVCLDGRIWSKPDSPEHAIEILKALNGRTHQVITGVALCSIDMKIREVFDVITEVTFCQATDQLITEYVRSGEPLDKAGAYGIQGFGALFIKNIQGSYSNIMGLPLFELGLALRRHLGDEIFFHGGSSSF